MRIKGLHRLNVLLNPKPNILRDPLLRLLCFGLGAGVSRAQGPLPSLIGSVGVQCA